MYQSQPNIEPQDLDGPLHNIRRLCIQAVLSEGVTILNKEFRETQDSEVLNFPDPDKLEYINQVRSLLSIRSQNSIGQVTKS
jgi:hypothetical protein